MNAFIYKSKKSGKTYYLHRKEVVLKSKRKQIIYYFAGEIKGEAIGQLPEGYEIIENGRTGLPCLKKIKHADIVRKKE